MPSPNERNRNNVRAGIFVLVTVAIAVAVIVILSGAWETLTRHATSYTARYRVANGVSNLQSGGEVRIGGVLMGRVLGVRPELTPGEPFEWILVDFEVDNTVPLYADAKIFISTPILGTGAWLDIMSVGTLAAGPVSGAISGGESAGLLGTMLGPGQAATADRMIDTADRVASDIEGFSKFLASIPVEYDNRVVPILDDVKTSSGDIRSVTERVRHDDWPRWSTRVDTVTEWATEFGVRLDAVVADGQAFVSNANDVVTVNRDDVRTIVQNTGAASDDLKEIMSRVESETVDKVHALLDTGNDALANAQTMLTQLRQDYEGWSVDIGRTIGNSQLASQQLKLAMAEIRRSPWKLLYRPTDAELEHELLYDAARSFAMATADLKSATATARSLLDSYGESLAGDPQLRERLRRTLVDPLENYEHAQERLLDVLFTENP